jgi:subtilisin family serine protease
VEEVKTAIAMGVIVVIAAGNAGPDPNTIASPGTAPDAITMGAMNNDRSLRRAVHGGRPWPVRGESRRTNAPHESHYSATGGYLAEAGFHGPGLRTAARE